MNWQNTVQKPIWAFRGDGVQFYSGTSRKSVEHMERDVWILDCGGIEWKRMNKWEIKTKNWWLKEIAKLKKPNGKENEESGTKPKKPNGKENSESGAKSKGKEHDVEKER
jgi:hypothetical protein